MIEEIADLINQAISATNLDVMQATLERALELADDMIAEKDKLEGKPPL